jgi:rSAM/selenodomain-associated transferase 1
MRYPDSRLIVFARAPHAGKAKTRLIPRFGAGGAATLQARLIAHCLRTVTGAGLCPVELWCAPTRDDPFFHDCARRFGVGLHNQEEGDLGARMHAALASTLQRVNSAVLVGTDIPGLAAADVGTAFRALHGSRVDVVLGPTHDGGYYLIGMKQADRGVFEGIVWGGSAVYQDTLARLKRRGRRWQALREHHDVDTPQDYDALPEALKRALGQPDSASIVAGTDAEK